VFRWPTQGYFLNHVTKWCYSYGVVNHPLTNRFDSCLGYKYKSMKKFYWFCWWILNYPDIVWMKIKSYFKKSKKKIDFLKKSFGSSKNCRIFVL